MDSYLLVSEAPTLPTVARTGRQIAAVCRVYGTAGSPVLRSRKFHHDEMVTEIGYKWQQPF